MAIITVMSPEEFAEKMKKIAKIGDYDKSLTRAAYEERYSKAVELLCEALIDLGYGVGVRVFKAIPERYV